jgi:glutamyl-tRNA reductase
MNLEAKRMGQIIDGQGQDFHSGRKMPEVAPTIALLRDHLETIRQAEVHRLRGRLGQLSVEQKLAIEALTQGIIGSIMNTPIDILKTVAQESNSGARASEAATIIDTITRLFNLQDGKLEKPVWSKGRTWAAP